jgi:hypothetical protein
MTNTTMTFVKGEQINVPHKFHKRAWYLGITDFIGAYHALYKYSSCVERIKIFGK